jgi:ribosomal protein S18 acetylase RimI-like enzyme
VLSHQLFSHSQSRILITDLHIHLAASSDAYEIADMSRQYIEYGLPWRWTAKKVSRAISNSATNVAVAREGNQLAGFGIMEYHDEHAHLCLFAVHTMYRQRGVGRQLLTWLERVAIDSGVSIIRLEARAENVAARAFYSKYGYVEVAHVPGMYLQVADGVRFEKRLRAVEGA